MIKTFNTLYFNFSDSIEKHSILILRISLSIVYIWFGALKVFGMSPAGELVEKTVYWFRPEIFIPILGICEVIIGLGLLFKRLVPIAIVLLLLHMGVTFFPVFIVQTVCFDVFPYCPTLVGQYIIKNLVLISGALVIAGKHNKKYYNELNQAPV
ncbi:DoxX family protein [Flavobacterium soyangense]|uniref:DoxX family membrane protein n=1 Tax=Flavobacterium soyangense TaxID=2023265 RepID=A0A930U8U7_9FLAO|nr:DoxX family membrane protein [Flavobacterium soyangense]MBF2708846.1 DoxX family membrane protein [Flavobacterium soyangense]